MKNFVIKSTPWLIFALLILLYCLFSLDIIATTKYFSYMAYTIIIVCLIINIFDIYYRPKIQFGTLIVTVLIVIFALILHVILCFRPFTLKYVETPEGIKITGYDRNIDNDYGNFKLVLPDEIGGKKVVTIGSNAFYKSECFEVLVIPKYVKQIEESAFENSNITYVKLNDGLEKIGKYAFKSIYNENFLDFIIIPPSVSKIDVHALYSPFNVIIFQNSDLKENYENIIEMNSKVYFDISNYQLVDGVLYVETNDGATACAVQSSYEEIKILDEVTFYDISYKVKTIGKNACLNKNLEKIEIANTITTIEDYAFSNCKKLNSIIIPRSVVNMGENVFYRSTLKIFLEDKSIVEKWNNTWHNNNEIIFLD